jgi:hypothetical protein
MKISYRTLAVAFGALALPLLFVSTSTAQCGGFGKVAPAHASWRYQFAQPRLLRTAFATSDEYNGNEAGIVGFWHVKFVSKGTGNTPDLPDGTEFDAGYSQWHSDGTEIMNSGGRSPITGAFCLGVWKQVGERTYKLNHFAAAWDATGSTLIGPANILEEVTLSPNGNQFSGNFTINNYTEAGTRVAHIQGVITGTRITVETPPQSIF